MQQLMLANRTEPVIKWIVISIFGILPFALLIWLVGPELGTISVSHWRTGDFVTTIPYGMMWVAGFITVILCSIAISLLSMFSKDVKTDVIPWTVGFLFMGLGFYVIPLGGWYSLFFIIIAPILFIVGLMIAAICLFFASMKKMAKEIEKMQQDPEVKKQMEEMQKQMQTGQNPFAQQPKKPKDKEENYKDNPFVDVEPDEDEEDKK